MDEENIILNIFALSDYSLIHIFKYVTATDLYNLSLTCKRFEGLVKEKKLWQKIDARGNPNSKEKIKYCIDRINERTTDFLLCSEQRDTQILPDDFFSSNACSKLTVLALENQLVRGDLAKVSEYPKTLVELSLRKSFVNSHSTFFKLSYLQMENLKVLILDECGWVETYMLVQMSKYAKLEVLSLFKCKKLSDNDIAYLSLAGCFGFKQLRILDIRFTGLGDQILKTFYKHATLQELYFQNYISTYALDKAHRLLELAHGASKKSHSYISKYDDIPDTNLESLREYFGNHNYRTSRRQNLSNDGTVMYKLVIPNIDDDYEVKSVLYKSPYGECTCDRGEKKSFAGPEQEQRSSWEDDEIAKLQDIIAEENDKKFSPYMYALAPKLQMDPYKNKTNISFYEQQASESNKQIDWINVREPTNLFEIAMFEHTDIHSMQSDIILPLDIMTALGCVEHSPPAVILGDPGPEFYDNNIEEALSDVDVVSDYSSDETGENNDEFSKKRRDLEDSDVIDDKLKNESEDHKESFNLDNSFTEPKEDNLKTDCIETCRASKESDPEDVKAINGATPNGKLDNHQNGESSRGESELRKSKNGNYKGKRWSKTNGDNKSNKTEKDSGDDKCKTCGVKIFEVEDKSDRNICRECSKKNKSDDVENNITSFTVQKNNRDKNDTRTTQRIKVRVPVIQPNLPSTSRMEDSPPTACLRKRKRDNSTNTPDAKRIRLNDNEGEPSRNPRVNVTYANVNVRRSNTVYININMPDRDDDEPGLINVPMGGGLINILLGVDNKTKTAIKKLSLRGFPKITDCTLGYLTALKLDLLDITKTGISSGAVSNFIRENPTCRVLHESACVCRPDMHF